MFQIKYPSMKKSKWLLASLALVLSTPSQAEYYFAVDATYMDAKTLFRDGTTNFELAPIRLKFGHRYKEFGWEIQALAPSDDTGEFSGAPGDIDKYELRGGLGALLTVSSENRRYYGGIGFTQILADYSVLTGALAGSSTTESTPFTTINLGAQFEVSKNTRLTLDYTFYHGDINCTFCTGIGPGTTDPDVRLSTFGIGLSFTF